MGNDFYETEPPSSTENPPLGIGEDCIIRKAIIDKQTRIGNNVMIENKDQIDNFRDQDERYWIQEGFVVIPREAILPDDFII